LRRIDAPRTTSHLQFADGSLDTRRSRHKGNTEEYTFADYREAYMMGVAGAGEEEATHWLVAGNARESPPG
jgi:hypothetical protein